MPNYSRGNGSYLVKDTLVDTYLREIKGSKGLSSADEYRLAERIRGGDEEAEQKLVEANLRFVVSVAKEYQNRGLPLGDLINSGNLSLITAAKRFDEGRKCKFISYAVWWIRQGILQALAGESRTIRLPLSRVGLLHSINNAQKELGLYNLDSGSIEEIADYLDIGVEKVRDAVLTGRNVLSLDDLLDEEDDNPRSRYNFTEDPNAERADETAERDSLKEDVREALKCLTDGERKVLTRYYGLDGREPMTLEEIAGYDGRTRERIRQIKEKALLKLRRSESDKLREHYE